MAFQKGNKYSLGLTTNGRPPIYSDPKEVYDKCVEYFENCIENSEKATITGLALYLGFSSRGTLNEYAKKDDFSDVVKRAMLTVENSYEVSGTTFDMFALKNMGWEDSSKIDHTTAGGKISDVNLTDKQIEKIASSLIPKDAE